MVILTYLFVCFNGNWNNGNFHNIKNNNRCKKQITWYSYEVEFHLETTQIFPDVLIKIFSIRTLIIISSSSITYFIFRDDADCFFFFAFKLFCKYLWVMPFLILQTELSTITVMHKQLIFSTVTFLLKMCIVAIVIVL